MLLDAVIKSAFAALSRIDLCLDSCSPAEPGFLLALAPSQLDMTGMKIRVVRAEGCKDGSDPAVVPDASHPAAFEHPRAPGIDPCAVVAARSILCFLRRHLHALKALRGLLLRRLCCLRGCSPSILLP